MLQLKRLQRHYESAVHSYDEVSLLDLSHSLRIWVELKQPLKEAAPTFAAAKSFKTAMPTKKALKATKRSQFVFSCMPGNVITYASKGRFFSHPHFAKSTMGCYATFRSGYAELGNFVFIADAVDIPLGTQLSLMSENRLNFANWLGAEVVRLGYLDEHAKLKKISISRQNVIKRMANSLGGSHPSKVDDSDFKNQFDIPVRHLFEYGFGGLPLPYFILLKIAQDILDVAPKLIENYQTTE